MSERDDRGTAAPGMAGMNVVLFITDQDRAIQHFPRGWTEKNLPGLTRLQRHGLTFNNAFTNSCMCTPARATLMTGYFPAQHGAKYTLELDMSAADGYPQVEMPLDLANPARVLSRCDEWVLGPEGALETTGDVPNVVFPCGLTHDESTDRLCLYYGAADTRIGLATAVLSEVMEYVLSCSNG